MKFWVCQDKKLINIDLVGYDNVLVPAALVCRLAAAPSEEICKFSK
jgi:hypothetical protein